MWPTDRIPDSSSTVTNNFNKIVPKKKILSSQNFIERSLLHFFLLNQYLTFRGIDFHRLRSLSKLLWLIKEWENVTKMRISKSFPFAIKIRPKFLLKDSLKKNGEIIMYLISMVIFHGNQIISTWLKDFLSGWSDFVHDLILHLAWFIGSKVYKFQTITSSLFNPFPPKGVPHWRVKSSGVRQSKIYKCQLMMLLFKDKK